MRALDRALASNNLERVASTMDQFERQFENLDVQSQFVEGAMNAQASLATPEEDVNMLLQQARGAPPACSTPSACACMHTPSAHPAGSPIRVAGCPGKQALPACSLSCRPGHTGLHKQQQKALQAGLSRPSSVLCNEAGMCRFLKCCMYALDIASARLEVQVADEHGLETQLNLPQAGAALPAKQVAAPESDLTQRLAQLRGK